MALIKCHECGRDVSDTAPSCPNCGAKPNARKLPTSARVFIAVLGAIAVFAIFGDHGNGTMGASSTQTAPSPLGSIGIDVLYRAYQENSVAADLEYKGRRYYVTGTVRDINTSITGSPYVVLENPFNTFMGAHMKFHDGGKALLSTLSPGSSIRGNCVITGDVAKVPMMSDCYSY